MVCLAKELAEWVYICGVLIYIKDKVSLVKNSLIILSELVDICRKNGLLINFLPRLTFFLKSIKHLESVKRISSYEDLISELDDNILPEICLEQKIFYTNNINTEKYEYPIYKTIFSKLISNPSSFFNDNYYFIHSFIRYEDDIEEMADYKVSFDILYNENNSETVTNVKRISFKE